MTEKLALLIATWFYSGLVRIGQKERAGTYGSFAALPLCVPLVLLCWINPDVGGTIYYLTIIVIAWIGIDSVPVAEKALGQRTDYKGRVRVRDQNQIVIDEVLGMLISCVPIIFYPQSAWFATLSFLAAFGAFRLFDIWKPWPIKFFDRQESAAGVMLDDVVAAIYALILVYLFERGLTAFV